MFFKIFYKNIVNFGFGALKFVILNLIIVYLFENYGTKYVQSRRLVLQKIIIIKSLDYVYFETYPSFPYQIRRIEELNKVSFIFLKFFKDFLILEEDKFIAKNILLNYIYTLDY